METGALAYAGAGVDGFLKTFTIARDGATITAVMSLEHDPFRGAENSLAQVDADTFALAYWGDVGGFVKTFAIPAPGSSSPVEIPTLSAISLVGLALLLLLARIGVQRRRA